MQIYKVGVDSLSIGPLSSKLKSSLYVGPTLWLVSGGSNIHIASAVMQNIDIELSRNLTVALADERFGPYGHPDSNWTQLKEAGFDPKQARVIEVLTQTSADLEATTKNYAEALSSAMYDVNTFIGQFGMGSDGHIAGILPHSPASEEHLELAIGYKSDPYTRITVTFECIRHLNSAFLNVFGESKREQIEKLINQNLPLNEQPAQIIKQVGESYVYNDQLGG